LAGRGKLFRTALQPGKDPSKESGNKKPLKSTLVQKSMKLLLPTCHKCVQQKPQLNSKKLCNRNTAKIKVPQKNVFNHFNVMPIKPNSYLRLIFKAAKILCA